MMKRTKQDRKPGRLMPHTDEAVRQDGTLDLDALEAAGKEVMASFRAKEYLPLSQGVTDLGNDYEIYWLYRKKGTKKA